MSPNELLQGVFIHDGGNVERKDTGETEFPKEIKQSTNTYWSTTVKINVQRPTSNIQHFFKLCSPLKMLDVGRWPFVQVRSNHIKHTRRNTKKQKIYTNNLPENISTTCCPLKIQRPTSNVQLFF